MVWSTDTRKGESEEILEGGGGMITNCTVSVPIHTNCTIPPTDEQHATHHPIFIHIDREIHYPPCVPWYTTIGPTDHYKYTTAILSFTSKISFLFLFSIQ